MVDRRFIDVDLSVPPEGHATGLIEQPPAELLASYQDLPWFDEICRDDMVPRSQWRDRAERVKAALRGTVAEIYSQGRTSACVGFACAQACETTHNRRYGRRHRVPLSGMSVYDQIGRTLMSGAYIPDGVAFLQQAGPLPLQTAATAAKYAVTFPGLEYRWSRPAGWRDVARLFRVTKAAKAQGADMVASALIKGRAGIVGRDNHAIPYVLLDFNGSAPVACYANSWSKDWGDAGFGYDSERVFGGLVMYVILEVAARPDLAVEAIAT